MLRQQGAVGEAEEAVLRRLRVGLCGGEAVDHLVLKQALGGVEQAAGHADPVAVGVAGLVGTGLHIDAGYPVQVPVVRLGDVLHRQVPHYLIGEHPLGDICGKILRVEDRPLRFIVVPHGGGTAGHQHMAHAAVRQRCVHPGQIAADGHLGDGLAAASVPEGLHRLGPLVGHRAGECVDGGLDGAGSDFQYIQGPHGALLVIGVSIRGSHRQPDASAAVEAPLNQYQGHQQQDARRQGDQKRCFLVQGSRLLSSRPTAVCHPRPSAR